MVPLHVKFCNGKLDNPSKGYRSYMSFWARWDASSNRQLIHEILEAYEERLVEKKRSRNSKVKKERRKANKGSRRRRWL
ncbi:hypothetical protein DVH24_010047 [Malus domestica]|uniref:Uncharacterized protein n=1 Tax=Malus domestica TaxID=3750 RepID=A0A498JW60_MALDO|nr:hypothetical protein DVH24_010047 [Malus domestica]